MCRKEHSLHRCLYYPWFQASTEGLGMDSSWIKGAAVTVILLLGIYPSEIKMYVHTMTCTSMLKEVLFKMTKKTRSSPKVYK